MPNVGHKELVRGDQSIWTTRKQEYNGRTINRNQVVILPVRRAPVYLA